MKLSIIIPVYLVEDTLDRCIKSVLRQSLTEYELILVDDGSPDGCGRLCDEIASGDQRVTVIHQKNGGLSDARNAGIAIARGDYVTFIDSDDYLEAGTLEPLMRILAAHPEYDILEYPAFLFYGTKKQRMLRFHPQEYGDRHDYWLKCRAYEHAYAWNKIYRKTLFDNVRYPVGILFEDVPTLWLLLRETHIIATTDKGRYYYCANGKGITSTADGHTLNMLLQSHISILRDFESRERDVGLKSYYADILNIQMDVCRMTGDEPTIPVMKFPFNLHSTTSLISETKLLLLNILGIKKLCKINISLNKLRHRW